MCEIKLEKICKSAWDGKMPVSILRELNLEVHAGDFITITGASGAGKTSLIKIIGFMDRMDRGSYILRNKKIDTQKDNQLAKYRERFFGYIPQSCDLIESMNVFENIAIPLYIRNSFDKTIVEKVRAISRKLAIEKLLDKQAGKLSLGEKQRVAIARACVKEPACILADEPTASLDGENKDRFVALIKEMNRKGTTIILVTHDEKVEEIGRKKFFLEKGQLV